jgi:hypothetical protein
MTYKQHGITYGFRSTSKIRAFKDNKQLKKLGDPIRDRSKSYSGTNGKSSVSQWWSLCS